MIHTVKGFGIVNKEEIDVFLELSCFLNDPAFEEVSGPRVLLKSGPGNRGRSAFGPTHVARLEFPREENSVTGKEEHCMDFQGVF